MISGIEYRGIKPIKEKKQIKKEKSYRETNYFSFGKFILNRGRLNNENILLVKYHKNNGPVSKIRRTKISDDFKNLINDLFDSEIINTELQKELNEKEQDLFELLLKLAGLDIQLNYKRYVKSIDDYKKRFNILRGAIIAGNHNPEIIQELINIIDLLSNNTLKIISIEDSNDFKDYLNSIRK